MFFGVLVKSLTAGFLHHDCHDQIGVFGNTVFFSVLLNDRTVVPDFHTDRRVGFAVAPASEHGNGTAENHHDQNNNDRNPAAGNQKRHQCFCGLHRYLDGFDGGANGLAGSVRSAFGVLLFLVGVLGSVGSMSRLSGCRACSAGIGNRQASSRRLT